MLKPLSSGLAHANVLLETREPFGTGETVHQGDVGELDQTRVDGGLLCGHDYPHAEMPLLTDQREEGFGQVL